MNTGSEFEKDMYIKFKDYINKNISCNEIGFYNSKSSDKKLLLESYLFAKAINEKKHDEFYEGYKDTKVYNKDGSFNDVEATYEVMIKSNTYKSVRKYLKYKGSILDYILLGDDKTDCMIIDALKVLNNNTAADLNYEDKLLLDEVRKKKRNKYSK